MTRVVEVRMSEAQRRKSPKYGSPRAKQNRDGFKRFQAGRLIRLWYVLMRGLWER
jgi:hypothetical protein